MGDYQGTFHINLDDKNYIAAIAAHHPEALITSIIEEGKNPLALDLKKSLLAKNLPEMIEPIKSRGILQISVNYTIENPSSFLNILPKINHEGDVTPDFYREPTLAQAKEYVSDRIYFVTSDWEVVRKTVDPFKGSLNKTEALYLIESLEYPNALELPQRAGFIFEADSKCFYLGWGKRISIRSIDNLTFNIDNGFADNDPTSTDKLKQDVIHDLQDYFLSWKSRGYEGALFPQRMNFVDDKEETSLFCPCLSFFSSSRPKYKPVPQDDLLEETGLCTIC